MNPKSLGGLMFEPMEDARETFHAAFKKQITDRFQPRTNSPEEAAIAVIFASGIPFNCWDLKEGPEDPPRWEGDEAWDRWKNRFMQVAKAIEEEWNKYDHFDPAYEVGDLTYCWKVIEKVRQMQA
jgi:hypothetical protein